ncbi:hypothetical protein FH972_009322 [Carpinus fangiana]|uniref:Ribosomal RNA methyltransferase FtsJ domain-containing protein n=1 Tax=Carpinus fangiana TaxID=176857 RepID=A0A5N6R350_9ROSI|nr:hypothetical protein FH972_009322 [Carpinus fangiana]
MLSPPTLFSPFKDASLFTKSPITSRYGKEVNQDYYRCQQDLKSFKQDKAVPRCLTSINSSSAPLKRKTIGRGGTQPESTVTLATSSIDATKEKEGARRKSKKLADSRFYRLHKNHKSQNQADNFTEDELQQIGLGYDWMVRFMEKDDPNLRHPYDWYKYGEFGPYSWRGVVIGDPIRGRFSNEGVTLSSEIITQFKEQGLNTEVYYTIKEMGETFSIVPTTFGLLMCYCHNYFRIFSCKISYANFLIFWVCELYSGEGIPYLLLLSWDKAGTPVSEKAVVQIKPEVLKYVCRAGYKLEAAIEQLGVDVSGKEALDSGLSTGEFTDCLLQYGASFVYGIDVGYGQVLKHERTNK